MAGMAIAAYIAPPQVDQMQTMFRASAPGEAARLAVYLDVYNERDTDLVRLLREARALLTNDRHSAEATEAQTEAAYEHLASQLSDLLAAQKQHREVHTEVLAQTEMASHDSGLIGLELTRLNQPILAAAQQAKDQIPLASVRGFRVHGSIADQLAALLEAADAAEVKLGGGGYRTNDQQIQLRRAHCGDDEYSVWEKPANECSPPTARPGNSLHELGLAIDFTYRNNTIGSQASPGFQWLAVHGPAFGFHNLPSEPWHWSVSGS